MTSKLLSLALFLCFSPLAKGQEFAAKQLIVSLPEGGFVSFTNQTAWMDIRQSFDRRKLPSPLGSQALADRNGTIHRVLRDIDGKFVFGYDLSIAGDSNTKQFTISVKPLDREMENALRANDHIISGDSVVTFPKSTEPQTVNDGAEFSLDLLINNSTGVKIIEGVKVTFDRARLGNDGPALRPRDFTLDAVALEMKDYSLLVNDNLIATGKSKSGCAGTLLWIYIPNRGRFIFSLFPREGYLFQKTGTVTGNKIEFTLDGDHYQWMSSSPILREEGTWNLWVLHDVKYSPLFAVRQPPATEQTALEKLDALINGTIKRTATVKSQKPSALLVSPEPRKTEKSAIPRRDPVMMGGADRIENLLPRN